MLKKHTLKPFFFFCLIISAYSVKSQNHSFGNKSAHDSLYQWHWEHNEYYKKLDSLQSAGVLNKLIEKKKVENGFYDYQSSTKAKNTTDVWNCQDLFLSGSNIAWINFAGDVGNNAPNATTWRNMFRDLKSAGGNSMRWWLHTNVSYTPVLNSNGQCTGLGTNVISHMTSVLDIAWEEGVAIDICLFSFDMLQDQWGMDAAVNKRFLESTSNIDSYITNALTPMVNALKDHPALLCWEIFNEPEGMTNEFGWTPTKVSMATIQQFVNKLTGAIHRLDSENPVTNGCWSFRALWDGATGNNERNYYRDDRLIAAGGDQDGTLDFYQVHYYDWAQTALSPFHHPKSYWGLNKELMVAEFHADETFGVARTALYKNLYDNGYFGAWGWQYSEDTPGDWNNIKSAMQSFYNGHASNVDVDADACLGGNQAPVVALTSPTNNSSYETPASISIAATASDADGSIANVAFYQGNTLLTTDNSSPYSYTWNNVTAGDYTITAVATDDLGKTTTSAAISIRVTVPQGPYGGNLHVIPGTIQAEEFDLGGQDVAYYDNTEGSEVTPVVNYRTDTDVDLEPCTDTGGGYNIGYAVAGEWLEYSVEVTESGVYSLELRLSSDLDDRTFHIEMDGENITGSITVPNTGGWQAWQTVTLTDIDLTEGEQIMRIVIDVDYVNINYVTFIKDIETSIDKAKVVGLEIYPNPVNHTIHLRNVTESWQLYNSLGEKIMEGNATTIDVSNEMSGVYFLKLGEQVKKIILE